jgi:hypothetical protein
MCLSFSVCIYCDGEFSFPSRKIVFPLDCLLHSSVVDPQWNIRCRVRFENYYSVLLTLNDPQIHVLCWKIDTQMCHSCDMTLESRNVTVCWAALRWAQRDRCWATVCGERASPWQGIRRLQQTNRSSVCYVFRPYRFLKGRVIHSQGRVLVSRDPEFERVETIPRFRQRTSLRRS